MRSGGGASNSCSVTKRKKGDFYYTGGIKGIKSVTE